MFSSIEKNATKFCSVHLVINPFWKLITKTCLFIVPYIIANLLEVQLLGTVESEKPGLTA